MSSEELRDALREQGFYERTVKVDLRHVIRLEPLESSTSVPPNGDK